jgi:multidrug efflux pump subunit AcrA (membrane-fusion protein)
MEIKCHMKRSAFAIFRTGFSNFKFQISIFLLLLFTACSSPENHDHVDADTPTYTCPMHPTVVSDKPGTCPVCGMDLVRKARPGETVEITEDLSKLLKSPNETIVASVKTVKGQYKAVPVTVNAQGVVTYDTRNIYTVPARVGGRLERIYFKYEFQPVSKGQKIAEIYSPELITAQREMIFLLEHDPENKSLIDAARRKLELLGMTNRQIDDLSRTKEAGTTISVYSPHSGYVITGQQAPTAPAAMPSGQQAGGGMSDGMGASRSSGSTTTPQQPQGSSSPGASMVREGDYVAAGETLFTVVNANALRIELNLPGSYTGAVKKGSKVQLDLGTGNTAVATVDFIQPFFGEGQEFMKVRVYTNKTEDLHIGHLVNATIHLESRESLWIPKEAVVDLGTQKVVFVKERGVLKPKRVSTGITTEGMIEITSGLASSEEIAANAQYLVDSESFIRIGK